MRRFSNGPRKTNSVLAGQARAGRDAAELAAPCGLNGSQQEPECSSGDLNLAERLVARLGEWVGGLPEWWMPEYIPAFAGDTQLAARCSAFATKAAEECEGEAQ